MQNKSLSFGFRQKIKDFCSTFVRTDAQSASSVIATRAFGNWPMGINKDPDISKKFHLFQQ